VGTNYYWTGHTSPPCPIHIGKSSIGWVFGFHAIPDRGLVSWAAWRAALEGGGVIRDEYGEVIPLERFVQIVTAKAGLARRSLSRSREGYDMHEGTFS
jgi:hypothetical protein